MIYTAICLKSALSDSHLPLMQHDDQNMVRMRIHCLHGFIESCTLGNLWVKSNKFMRWDQKPSCSAVGVKKSCTLFILQMQSRLWLESKTHVVLSKLPSHSVPGVAVSCMTSHIVESQVFMPRGVYGGSAPRCFSVTESHLQQPEPDTDEAEDWATSFSYLHMCLSLMMCEKEILN